MNRLAVEGSQQSQVFLVVVSFLEKQTKDNACARHRERDHLLLLRLKHEKTMTLVITITKKREARLIHFCVPSH